MRNENVKPARKQERKARNVAERNIRNIEAAHGLGIQHQAEDDESFNRRWTGHLNPFSTHQDDFERVVSAQRQANAPHFAEIHDPMDYSQVEILEEEEGAHDEERKNIGST